MNLHGAIDLEGGQTRMREVLTVDAMSTIELVMMMSWTFRTHPARTTDGSVYF